MKIIRKLTGSLLLLALTLSFAIIGSAAAGDTLVSERNKDQILFSLTLNAVEENTKGDLFRAVVSAENKEAAYVRDIRAELILPEGLTVSGDLETVLALPAVGEMASLSFLVSDPAKAIPEETLPESEPETVPPATEPSGCQSSAGGAIVLLALSLTAFGIFFAASRSKRTRSTLSLLLAVLTVLPLLALPASAATRERSLTLEKRITVGDTEYTVGARITYTYDYTAPEVTPTSGFDEFEITYYWGPHYVEFTDEVVKTIAECGFTSIPLEHCSTEVNKATLTLMKQYGLKCSALWDGRIQALFDTSPEPTQETVDATIQAVVADYAGFDNLEGWLLLDEPNAARFSILGKVVSAFRRFDPERDTMINLFPTYASATQLGQPTYNDYVEAFINEVQPHYISYDHYHFRNSGERKGFFENLAAIREAGLDSGLDQMLIILLTEHLSYANLTKDQIEWEVNMSLAYGMKRISYFTYFLDTNLLDGEGWSNSCVNYKGEKYQHYYDVQEINKWLLPLGQELFSKTSTGVYHLRYDLETLETGCKAYYRREGDLGEVSGERFVIGFFDDNSFMIVNKRYDEGEAGKNVLTLIDVMDGLEYFDPTDSTWKSADDAPFTTRNDDGQYVLTFDSAQGILFRVK